MEIETTTAEGVVADGTEEIIIDEPVVTEESKEVEVTQEPTPEETASIINQLVEIVDTLEATNNELSSKASTLEEQLTAFATEKESLIEQLKSEIAAKEELIVSNSDLNSAIDAMEAAYSRITENANVGPIAKALAAGEEVDIPKYLEEILNSRVEAIPNFSGIERNADTGLDKVKESLNDRLKRTNF